MDVISGSESKSTSRTRGSRPCDLTNSTASSVSLSGFRCDLTTTGSMSAPISAATWTRNAESVPPEHAMATLGLSLKKDCRIL